MKGFGLRASGFGKGGFGRRCVLAVLIALAAPSVSGEDGVLNLRAKVVAAPTGGALTIAVLRWSTEAERTPLLTALSAPPPPPPAAAAPAGRAAGRGGRGGRGAPPLTPLERLAAAVRRAPTVGYIWGDGVTGYSIKYAWRSPAADRVVLVIDRRLGAHAPEWALAAAPGPQPDFTLIELRLDAAGAGAGKTSLAAAVVVDPSVPTLALDRFSAAATLLEVSQ